MFTLAVGGEIGDGLLAEELLTTPSDPPGSCLGSKIVAPSSADLVRGKIGCDPPSSTQKSHLHFPELKKSEF